MRRVLPAALATLLTASFLLAGPHATAEPAAVTAAEPAAPASTFTPRSPLRVLDTRTGTGVSGPVGPGRTITLDLAPHVPATATAVVLNVTGVGPTAGTYVTAFPSGVARPTVSNLNLPAGDVRANQVTVALGADRRISLYNNAGSIHLVADLAGHYGTGAGDRFTALPPNRRLDTRVTGGPLGPGGTRVLDLTGAIPESATAVTFNLTATGNTAGTYVTAWPTGASRPTASNVNLPARDTRPNLVTVAVDADQRVSLYNTGSTHLIVDLTGFYTADYGAAFVPLNPERVLDTRTGTGTGGSTDPVGPQGFLELDLAGELPVTSTGVVLNLTGVNATVGTYVTAWAPVGNLPNASTLNLPPGRTVPNAAVVAFALSRSVGLSNYAGSVHLVADLAGVFVVDDSSPCTTECAQAWGDNSLFALGTGEITTSSSVPKPVVDLSGVRAVEGRYALLADGTVWAWGSNGGGRLGNGWTSPVPVGGSAVPAPVVGLTGVTEIASRGDTAYALRADGTVWAWGYNFRGQLGNGSRADSGVPVRVSGLTDVVAIGAGDETGYAVRADGTLWAWGSNGGGHLGNGSTVDFSTTPVRVTGLNGITAVAGGGASNGTYALRDDGTVWAWGYNFAGALGHGQPCVPGEDCLSRVPVQVSGLTGVTAVASGVYNGQALRADGTVWTWGANDQGQLGNGTDCTQDQQVCDSHVPVQVSNLSDVTQIAAFFGGGYALRANGTVMSWGVNYMGTLGNDTVAEYTTVPVPVQELAGAHGIGSSLNSGYAIVP